MAVWAIVSISVYVGRINTYQSELVAIGLSLSRTSAIWREAIQRMQ